MKTARYLSCLALLLLIIHIMWSATVVGLFRVLYDHRVISVVKMLNVGREWEDFTASFSGEVIKQAKKGQKPLAMFVGSSVTYGFPWQERIIFTRLISGELSEFKIANLSIIGVGMRAITDFATCALSQKHRPDIIFFEIPLVNSTASISPGVPVSGRRCNDYSSHVPGYWPLVFRRFFGIGWISLLWDDENYEKKETDLKVVPLPEGYFANSERFSAIENTYSSELRAFLSNISSMGERVFVYVSPIYVPGISMAGADRSAVEYQIKLTQKICLEFVNLTCLDSSIFSQRPELFYNLTHLNHRGHRALADWFKPYITSQGRSDVPQRPPSLTN
jgi:hypothetical protein